MAFAIVFRLESARLLDARRRARSGFSQRRLQLFRSPGSYQEILEPCLAPVAVEEDVPCRIEDRKAVCRREQRPFQRKGSGQDCGNSIGILLPRLGEDRQPLSRGPGIDRLDGADTVLMDPLEVGTLAD